MKIVAHIISPLSHGVTKSGQVTSYRSGDDGEYEGGWWLGRLNANNRQRFVLHPTYPDDLVMDRATGLIWPRNGNGPGCNNNVALSWSDSIDYALGSTWLGYSDWRMPSIKELLSVIDYGKNNPAVDTNIFLNTNPVTIWTGSTYRPASVAAWTVSFTNGYVAASTKTLLRHLRIVKGML